MFIKFWNKNEGAGQEGGNSGNEHGTGRQVLDPLDLRMVLEGNKVHGFLQGGIDHFHDPYHGNANDQQYAFSCADMEIQRKQQHHKRRRQLDLCIMASPEKMEDAIYGIPKTFQPRLPGK